MLLALVRGGGPRGLAGMPARRGGRRGRRCCARCWGVPGSRPGPACAALGLDAVGRPAQHRPGLRAGPARAALLGSLVDALGPGVVANLARTAALVGGGQRGPRRAGRARCSTAAPARAGLRRARRPSPTAVRGRVLHAWALAPGVPRHRPVPPARDRARRAGHRVARPGRRRTCPGPSSWPGGDGRARPAGRSGVLTGLERRPVFAPHGVVATVQPLAAAAGLARAAPGRQRGRRGGGHRGHAHGRPARLQRHRRRPVRPRLGRGELYGLNASGRSPAALTRAAALAHQVDGRLPDRGWLPVTVPGAPAGWRDLHERFGRLPFAELFADAIGYAEQGFPVSPTVARHWPRAAADPCHAGGGRSTRPGPRCSRAGGRAPAAGRAVRATRRAGRTLRLIAATGRRRVLPRRDRRTRCTPTRSGTGGLLTYDDLAGHELDRGCEPLSRGVPRPRGVGAAAQRAGRRRAAGAVAAGRSGRPDRPVEGVHVQIEAMKLAFADAHAYVADPDLRCRRPDLLDAGLRGRRRGRSSGRPGRPAQRRATRPAAAPSTSAPPTRDGMMVSLIQSNYMGFGSFVVLPGYGFGAAEPRGRLHASTQATPTSVGPAQAARSTRSFPGS